ncbi:MAG: 5-bromo-4-chloroindolyl phosphate hydrolysis protein [Granulosicoccus sp.]|nr:5-bromo-4-chloroindolyl phosphate hydrolysis protein [Granulosicoccus sp.]
MAAVTRIDSESRPAVLWRGFLLYLLAFPLLPATFLALMDGRTVEAMARGAGFILCMAAATLIRKGIRLDNEARKRRLRRRASTVRYRLVGAVLVAAGIFLVAWLGLPNQYDLFDSVLWAIAVLVGCYLYYDFDSDSKGPDIAAIGITTEELVELLDEAEGKLLAIENSSRRIHNIEFKDRLRRIVKEARDILDTIERDPVDARRARKFLKVYLDGAQQVTEGYARTHTEGEQHALEDNFRRVLTTIETVITEQQMKLAENNLSDLDVTIEVLQMQMEKEGVT